MAFTGTIYLIHNKKNGKNYIGQTVQPLQLRWRQHYNPCNKHCVKMHRAIAKYGKESFSITPMKVFCCSSEAALHRALDKWETYYIDAYDTVASGYNIDSGGHTSPRTEEVKAKIAKGMLGTHNGRGAIWTDEARKKCSGINRHIQNRHNIGAESSKKKKVQQYTLDDELVAEYPSISAAARAVDRVRSGINRVLQGKSYSAAGYKWKYV